jgi:hypothetical protein
MIRPPPLYLKYDNRFPTPLKTPSKPKASSSFVSQLYKANWKNAIIAVAGLNGFRYAFATYNAIADATIDDEGDFDDLYKVSLALAVIYLLAFFIEVYGVVSVGLQRLRLVRGYLYLTLISSLLVTCAGVLQGVSYFMFAEDVVMQCAGLAMQGRGYEKSLFRSRPWPNSIFRLQRIQAQKHCTYAWVHQSWAQVASVFLFFLLPSVIYALLVYTYYRQTVDPKHGANLQHNHSPRPRGHATRRPNMAQREAGAVRYPAVGYAPLGNNSSDDDLTRLSIEATVSQGLTTSRLQAGPAQSRPLRGNVNANAPANGTNTNPFATKGIKRSRRPPPLIPSPSPMGFTPGAPAFYGAGDTRAVGGRAGASRVYAAFAAPVGSAGYDKFV